MAQDATFLLQRPSRRLKHGHTIQRNRWRGYDIWAGMLGRCCNPRNVQYPLYGGRGIKVCDRWFEYENFIADMGPRPSRVHSVDRINNDGHYEPSNCRWATAKMQNRNNSGNRIVEYAGRKMCLSEAAELAGLKPDSVRNRIKRGWGLEWIFDPRSFKHAPRNLPRR